MPSRYMLLYGADDKELEKLGNINDNPDNFQGAPEDKQQKISVEMLRKGLKTLRYNVEDNTDPFDDIVYHAFLQYHWQYGRIKLDAVYEESDDLKKPLEEVAGKYGVFTWKYLHDNHNGDVNHERLMEELTPEYGDELLMEKGANPQMYKPGVSYHYVWVPFCPTFIFDGEFENV
jgi:hypothetical protein